MGVAQISRAGFAQKTGVSSFEGTVTEHRGFPGFPLETKKRRTLDKRHTQMPFDSHSSGELSLPWSSQQCKCRLSPTILGLEMGVSFFSGRHVWSWFEGKPKGNQQRWKMAKHMLGCLVCWGTQNGFLLVSLSNHSKRLATQTKKKRPTGLFWAPGKIHEQKRSSTKNTLRCPNDPERIR